MRQPSSNPFSSRYVRPGAIEFQSDETTVEALGLRLLRERRCQLTGPHGSGKSTLLHGLARWWSENAGPAVILRVGPDGRIAQRRELSATNHHGSLPLRCYDGWDGLPPLQRHWRAWRARRTPTLLTNHRPHPGWSQLMDCQPHLPTMLAIAQRLQRHLAPSERIGPEQVRAAFHRHQGNARETLFELYDVFEDQRAD